MLFHVSIAAVFVRPSCEEIEAADHRDQVQQNFRALARSGSPARAHSVGAKMEKNGWNMEGIFGLRCCTIKLWHNNLRYFKIYIAFTYCIYLHIMWMFLIHTLLLLG